MPYLEEWHQKYSDKGFTIIGVHAPEFDFERDPDNVRWAIDHFNIEHPVVLDNHFKIWHAYANSYWPRRYLILNGKILYDHIGEGAYRDTETQIRSLLQRVDPDLEFSGTPLVENPVATCQTPTPETYAGFSRGMANNPGGYRAKEEHIYKDPGDHREPGLYLNGRWLSNRQHLDHIGSDKDDYLVLSFSAVSVNIVAASLHSEPLRFSIDFNGKPLSGTHEGDDVSDSTVAVVKPRMYNIFRAKEFMTGTLKLKHLPDGLRLYAFSFGGCIGIP